MMTKEELLEVLGQVYDAEKKSLEEDGVDEKCRIGADFGMKFMIKIVSDCLDGGADFVREVYSN